MKKIILFFLFSLLFFSKVVAQEPSTEKICHAIIINGDTLPLIYLREIEYTYSFLLSDEEKKKYAKLIRNVKKVHPYAKLAKNKLTHYNETLSQTKDEKLRKEIMKQAEKEIEAEFGEDLKKLNFSQGKVLIKLIDRETGSTSFVLVQELRGKFRAFFYQTFARVFGFNLKSRYDPTKDKEDAIIERIILSIENEQI